MSTLVLIIVSLMIVIGLIIALFAKALRGTFKVIGIFVLIGALCVLVLSSTGFLSH